MISAGTDKKHQKHDNLNRAESGEFGRNEIALLGTTCNHIQLLASRITEKLSPKWKIAFTDAGHKAGNAEEEESNVLIHSLALQFTDRISHRELVYQQDFNSFQKQVLFNNQDLVLINGNHFLGRKQIIVIDPAKPLEKKLHKLTNVVLILLKEPNTPLPDYLKAHLTHWQTVPIFNFDDTEKIIGFVADLLVNAVPPLNGLVLSGGSSTRMQADKGSLNYHGKTQREHVFNLLSSYCNEVYVSCNSAQAKELAGKFPLITDGFLGLGPLGGILSAFRHSPGHAWLIVACDLPLLTSGTFHYLIKNRNPSKLATAYCDETGQLPEPLITIWEPRSYPVMLQFLAQGFSCPRKVLINSDVELLTAPDSSELKNVNFQHERIEVIHQLNIHHGSVHKY